jgi:hypothetical protein
MDEYLKQIEVSAIAGFLADHWQQSADCRGSIPIRVVPSRVVRVTDAISFTAWKTSCPSTASRSGATAPVGGCASLNSIY